MLQQPTPDDFVLATGEKHSVREFVDKSFKILGINLKYVFRILFLTSTSSIYTDGVELAQMNMLLT